MDVERKMDLNLFLDKSHFITGICELDDFMNNTVGAMIGYGFYRLCVFIVKKWRKQEIKVLPIVYFQIPFLVTAKIERMSPRSECGWCIFLIYTDM